MSRTKLQLVEAALEELGLPKWNFDIPPELAESAVHRMDGMVALWMETGLQLAYDFAASAAEPSGLALSDELAVYMNLAVSLAPSLGKTVATETKVAAATGLDAICIRSAAPRPRQMPDTMPRGDGQKPWRTAYYPYFPPPENSPLRTPQTDNLDIAKD